MPSMDWPRGSRRSRVASRPACSRSSPAPLAHRSQCSRRLPRRHCPRRANNARPLEHGVGLTRRQADVLRLVAAGLTYKEVAARSRPQRADGPLPHVGDDRPAAPAAPQPAPGLRRADGPPRRRGLNDSGPSPGRRPVHSDVPGPAHPVAHLPLTTVRSVPWAPYSRGRATARSHGGGCAMEKATVALGGGLPGPGWHRPTPRLGRPLPHPHDRHP